MGDTTNTLTIVTTPTASPLTEVLSAYLPIIFEVESSAVLLNIRVQAIVKHKTTFDIIDTIKQDPIDVGGQERFRFNVSNLLVAQLEPDILSYNGSNDIQTGGELSTRTFKVTFQAIFEDPFGEITIQESLDSLEYFVTNAIVQPQVEPQDLIIRTLTVGARKFLTNAPNNKPIDPQTEEEQLSFLGGSGLIDFQLKYQTFDLDGVPNAEQSGTIKQLVNHHGIININAQTILAGFANISKVDVWVFNDDSSVIASEKKTFVVQDNCPDDIVRIQWLNQFGAIDEFSFQNRKTRFQEFERAFYEKALPLNSFVDTPTNLLSGVKSKEKLIVSSGFLPVEYMDWFRELLESPQTWWHTNFSTKYAVAITPGSMQLEEKDELIELNLEFDISRDRITMSG